MQLTVQIRASFLDATAPHVRPHSSLKEITPFEAKARYDSIDLGAALNLQSVRDPWVGQ